MSDAAQKLPTLADVPGYSEASKEHLESERSIRDQLTKSFIGELVGLMRGYYCEEEGCSFSIEHRTGNSIEFVLDGFTYDVVVTARRAR